MAGSGPAVAAISLAGGRASITPRDLQRLLLGLGLATAMQFYTFDSVNLILPDMAGAFGASRDEASWILIAYTAALLLGTPMSSYLARRIGLRPYLVGAVLVFLAASIGCSLSTRLGEMLLFRSIEGFAGGALNFWWRGSVYLFLVGPARSAAMMRISVMLYAATATGLLVSGYLVDHLSWRFIWVIDAAFAAGALSLLLRYYPREVLEPERRSGPVDVAGAVLLGVALVALEVVLSRGQIDDWFGSPVLTGFGCLAVLALALFVVRVYDPRNRLPFLRLSLLGERHVIAAVAIGTLTGMIIAGAIYALPEYLRGVDPQPRSASQTGQILCIYAITAACVRPLVTSAIGRFGQRRITVFALICLILSMALFSVLMTTGTPAISYAPALILYALCLAPLLSAVGSGTAARVPGAGQIDAVSIYMTFRQLGTVLGVAFVNIVIDRRTSLHSSRLFEYLRDGGSHLQATLEVLSKTAIHRAGESSADASATALGLLHNLALQQASVLAFADAFRAMAVVGLVALAFTPLMSPPVKKT
ncbi:MAG: MFS transporter [Caulobacteraceae bacterium]|jgi:EmrB/QacA subfamily drug resistance transporter